MKYWAGCITSWNQDCQGKYQQPQICRLCHSNGRKWSRTKEPLDEDERGEWKSWLKTQHSKNWDHGIWSYLFMELNVQYFGHLIRKAESLERILMLRKIEDTEEGGGEWVGYIASLIQWTWTWANSGRQWRRVKPGVMQSIGSQTVEHDLETEQHWEIL